MNGTVIITGANGSLALGFVESFLASYPEHTLIATVRNPSPETDQNTAKLVELIAKYPKANAKVEGLDLGSLAVVRSLADNLAARISSKELPPISAIVCNAFTWSLESGQKFTSDGFEATFQVSHLAHYLLVLKLLDRMDRISGRVVMLGSITHYPERPNPLCSLRPGIPDNIEELIKPTPDPLALIHDRGFQRYGTAKLANVLFTEDLNTRLKRDPNLSNITALAMDPGGLLASRAQSGQKASVQRLFSVLNFLMPVLKYVTTVFRTNEDSGRDLVAVSLDPAFHEKRGYYIGQKAAMPSEVSGNVDLQKRLWDACWEWTGLTPDETALQNAAPGPVS
ncbi:uncharacterized protein APUU_41645S [Aspergillus puulaauensis]|uniref:Ketoreductase (KR) domain-containing protein n=1 Tax=Aspergillus puulaauensis TaxID=1220207 RepID=A0A7R7XP92_9EURO|nr:uncharacterized protein APUU_41645S [Aspergillus puulaauensis]BCS25201.1 hypothetical protein APUU_41645S [Aspergillus puulaauensis]